MTPTEQLQLIDSMLVQLKMLRTEIKEENNLGYLEEPEVIPQIPPFIPVAVIPEICHALGIIYKDLIGGTRKRPYPDVRSIISYEYSLLNISTTDIGKVLNIDRSSVITAISRYHDMYSKNALFTKFADIVRQIMTKYEN